MIVAITGASGFIGKLLVEKHILLGNQVRVLSRYIDKKEAFNSKVSFFKGDLSDVNSLKDFVDGVDVLYHCAAEIKIESLMRKVNVEGTENLIQAAKGRVRHWVQLSSTGVYGAVYNGIVSEEHLYNPTNEYEKTKLESDKLVLKTTENDFTYSILRPSNVFGAEMTNKSIFQLVDSVYKGFYFFIGKKGASANYVPVDNVVEALLLVATNPKAKGQIFIVSSWCTIENFIGAIAKSLNKKVPKFRISYRLIYFLAQITSFIPFNPLSVSRVKALTNRVIYDTSKIELILGYKPVVATDFAISKLVQKHLN
jgi:nucleoside-diphosphate-sugar epimerase